MPLAAWIGAIAAAHSIDDAPPELPQLIDGLQGWISTTRGRFRFGDGTSTPGHGKAVHEARNVEDQTVLFSQAIAGLRPTWDATTFDVPCIRSDGTQYLTRNTALPAPGLVIVGCAFDSEIPAGGFRALTGARSTETAGGDADEDAWHLNRAGDPANALRGLLATSADQIFADTPQILGDKLLVMLEIVGNTLHVWQVGATGEETIVGTRIVADGEQALLAKYYNDAVVAIMQGAIFEFAQYAPAPTRAERRMLVEYFQDLIWPAVSPPTAATINAGQIEQGQSELVDVVTPSSGTSLVLASVDEQPNVGSFSPSGDDIEISVPDGAPLGNASGHYCLRSDVAGARLVDFGRIDFEVVEAAEPPPPPPPLEGFAEDQPLPAPNNTHNVSNRTELNNAIAAAVDGDHIVMADADYGGAFSIGRDFSPSNRLVIRAANLHQATFSGTLTVSGGVIVSGLSITGGVRKNGSNSRVTRCIIRDAERLINYSGGVTDSLIDHCDLSGYTEYMNVCDPPKDQRRLTIARCWVHGAGTPGDGKVQTFAWNLSNDDREAHIDGIVRFNYVGPGLPNPLAGSDHVHNKCSSVNYAFNRWDENDAGNRLLHNRFGLNVWFIGNYAPNHRIVSYDGDQWSFGNNVEEVRIRPGNSLLFDDESNQITWDGVTGSTSIFFFAYRARYAANTGLTTVGHIPGGWPACNHDPQPAGQTHPNHPEITGLAIYNNPGPIAFQSDTCIQWWTNLTDQRNNPAPQHWLDDLPSWVTDVVDPTDPSAEPWALAQSLTRGDASNPNTGPFRNGPGGLP